MGSTLYADRAKFPLPVLVLLDLKLPNLIVTPHVAWAGDEGLQAFADQLIGNIEAFVAGHPRNRVA